MVTGKNEEVSAKLEAEKREIYIHGTVFDVPDIFYESYEIDKDKIYFSIFKPDFLKLNLEKNTGKLNIQIIDAKASANIKISHQIQVSFYSLLIRTIIRSEKGNLNAKSESLLQTSSVEASNQENDLKTASTTEKEGQPLQEGDENTKSDAIALQMAVESLRSEEQSHRIVENAQASVETIEKPSQTGIEAATMQKIQEKEKEEAETAEKEEWEVEEERRVKIEEFGGVWIPKYMGIDELPGNIIYFHTIPFDRILIELFYKMKDFYEKPEEIQWFFATKCHQCDFRSLCKSDTASSLKIGSVPDLSTSTQSWLSSLLYFNSGIPSHPPSPSSFPSLSLSLPSPPLLPFPSPCLSPFLSLPPLPLPSPPFPSLPSLLPFPSLPFSLPLSSLLLLPSPFPLFLPCLLLFPPFSFPIFRLSPSPSSLLPLRIVPALPLSLPSLLPSPLPPSSTFSALSFPVLSLFFFPFPPILFLSPSPPLPPRLSSSPISFYPFSHLFRPFSPNI